MVRRISTNHFAALPVKTIRLFWRKTGFSVGDVAEIVIIKEESRVGFESESALSLCLKRSALSMIDKCDPQEICRRASEALATSSVQEIRTLHVKRERDSLRVTGRVGSFYHKQLALETIRSVSRGMRIDNGVDVA